MLASAAAAMESEKTDTVLTQRHSKKRGKSGTESENGIRITTDFSLTHTTPLPSSVISHGND